MKSTIEVEISYFKPVTKTVRKKQRVRKKVNGRLVTVYEYRNVKVTTNQVYRRILPVTPEQVRVVNDRQFDDRETLDGRVYTALSSVRPQEIRLESFFTADTFYGFTQTNKRIEPVDYARWFKLRLEGSVYPIQVKVTGLGIRGYYHLRRFEYWTEAGTRDLNYSMVFVERNLPKVKAVYIK